MAKPFPFSKKVFKKRPSLVLCSTKAELNITTELNITLDCILTWISREQAETKTVWGSKTIRNKTKEPWQRKIVTKSHFLSG